MTKKRVEGWIIEEDNGDVTFYKRLPSHITAANAFHMYKGEVVYGTKETKKGKKK